MSVPNLTTYLSRIKKSMERSWLQQIYDSRTSELVHSWQEKVLKAGIDSGIQFEHVP